jgi:hypothetical protein
MERNYKKQAALKLIIDILKLGLYLIRCIKEIL